MSITWKVAEIALRMRMKLMELLRGDRCYFGSLIDLFGIVSLNTFCKVDRRMRCIWGLISLQYLIFLWMRKIVFFEVGRGPFRGRYRSSVIVHRKLLIYLLTTINRLSSLIYHIQNGKEFPGRRYIRWF